MVARNTIEDEQLMAGVYTKALETRSAGQPLSSTDQVIYEIEMLSQEVNSGASFEQYFRWASLDELSSTIDRLKSLGLAPVAEVTRQAFDVAFPNGLPSTNEDKEALTEWTDEQEEQLQTLADEFTEFNSSITSALAAYYRVNQGGI